MEPAVNGRAALLGPNTGIVDSHALMSSLHGAAAAAGALFSFGSTVQSIQKRSSGYEIGLVEEGYRFTTSVVVNAAGLSSDLVASMAGIDVDAAGYRLQYCKGSYFSYSGKSPINMLVYPVPQEYLNGLGVHATLDLGGRLRFGPDTENVDSLDYTVDPVKQDDFFESARKIINGLRREALMPDMAGVRPKIRGQGVKDFVICHETDRGLPGLINLVGIESPGLTACLAIANYVGTLVEQVLDARG